MVTVNIEKFTLTKSITNLTWKYLMKPRVLLNLVLQNMTFTAVWRTSTASKNSLLLSNNSLIHLSSSTSRSSWNQDILQPNIVALYCNVTHQKGTPLQNCFGFVDGTVLQISRPKINKKTVYNGHKRVHGIKFQSIALSNVLNRAANKFTEISMA